MLKLTTLICLLIFSQASLAGSKDCTSKMNAPLCPNSGATILDETYPTQTFVVSTQGYHTNDRQSAESNTKLPADFITSILESYKTDKPEIMVPTSAAEFSDLIKQVEGNLTKAKKSPKYIKEQLSLIKHIENTSYTWQQDYFESFISEETGRPVVREIASYRGQASDFKQTSLNGFQAMSTECPVEVGSPLKNMRGGNLKSDSWGNGEMGGNIEGLPGGLCLKGNNQAEEFVSQYCGKPEQANAVEVDVGWMEVGHVDEVIKVVPVNPKRNPDECNFTVWVASPDKGFEVLKDPSFINLNFIDLTGLDKEAETQKLKDLINSKAGDMLCDMLKDFKIPEEAKPAEPQSVPKSKKGKSAGIWDSFKKLLLTNAYAGAEVISNTESDDCEDKLKSITNRQMVELMEKDEDFVLMNKLIQEKMDVNTAAMKAKLNERLPQCKNISFLEVPDLFYGHGIAEVNGKKELAEPGNGRSLFPNPTNSVLANETMIVPQAPNGAFNNSVKKSLDKQGLKTTFVDTWNYAHAGDGNMHCSSHSLTYCKPKGQK